VFDGKRDCREYVVADLFPVGEGSESDDERSGPSAEYSGPIGVCTHFGRGGV